MKIRIILKLLSLTLLCVWSSYLHAEKFIAPADSANWVVHQSKLFCSLTHAIPEFGEAKFSQQAGERQEFALKSTLGRLNGGKVDISNQSQSWKSDKKKVHLATVQAKPGLAPLTLHKKTVYQLLEGLSDGMVPTFTITPRNTATKAQRQGKDVVMLQTAGFKAAYDDYLACIEEMVPYTYEEIKKTTFYFGNNTAALSREDKQKIEEIAKFINNDPNVTKVLIEGHSDSIGSFTANRHLSYRRMWEIKNHLIFEGVDRDLFELKAWADRKPIAKNTTKAGRAKNRRVEMLILR